MKDSRYWTTKMMHLKGVTGVEIVKKYNELSTGENTDVAATQIFLIEGKKDTKTGERIYDAFIYYKEQFANIKGLD